MNPLVSIACVLGLIETFIASAEQETCIMRTTVAWNYLNDIDL